MGMEVSKDSDFRYKCTRKSRKQLAAMSGYMSQAASPNPALSPSPSSGFRAFFGRKNSSPQTSLIGHSPSMPSPALSLSASTMEGGNSPESTALSPTISNQSILPMPYFSADPSLDTGGEVRFTVEVVRVKGLKGLYTLDLRRLKGNLTDYRENHVRFMDLPTSRLEADPRLLAGNLHRALEARLCYVIALSDFPSSAISSHQHTKTVNFHRRSFTNKLFIACPPQP
jgi:protein-serine/threonine kinase